MIEVTPYKNFFAGTLESHIPCQRNQINTGIVNKGTMNSGASSAICWDAPAECPCIPYAHMPPWRVVLGMIEY
ncbi:hypothetical protein VNO77_16377 [Canavalia gladiata]|uniref:Uncharacterized protein n=1 Tax=Canavalia gladiata TaxID=3824 RepID=A0AAN9M0X2_CANGL